MNLSDGKYLDKEICAVCGDWLVVYDGKYNYYLFNCLHKYIVGRYNNNVMPTNSIPSFDAKGRLCGSYKTVEYYTKFDNAVKNMCKIVANNGKWVQTIRFLSI